MVASMSLAALMAGSQAGTLPVSAVPRLPREEVAAWQNQFDTEIINVAKSSGVPSQLMKMYSPAKASSGRVYTVKWQKQDWDS